MFRIIMDIVSAAILASGFAVLVIGDVKEESATSPPAKVATYCGKQSCECGCRNGDTCRCAESNK